MKSSRGRRGVGLEVYLRLFFTSSPDGVQLVNFTLFTAGKELGLASYARLGVHFETEPFIWIYACVYMRMGPE